MFGGFLIRPSLLALAALAAVLFSAPAGAADLGGDCCADLEERVAELEATTVRKGNTKVSLKIAGQINQAIMWWDSGGESDTYIGDNVVSGSRLKFSGSARVNPDLEAGFYLELDYRNNDLSLTDQTTKNGGSTTSGGATEVSDIMWYLRSKTLGRFMVGKFDAANDNITAITLSGTSAATDDGFNDWTPSFIVAPDPGGFSSEVRWSDIFTGQVGEGAEAEIVRYDTPTIGGFTLSASWNTDQWGAALRFANEFGNFRVAAGIGYGDDDAAGQTELGGSISLLHGPTGLFITAAAGEDDSDAVVTASGRAVDEDERKYYLQGGINKKFMPVGATRIYGEWYMSEGKGTTDCEIINTLDSDFDICQFGANIGVGDFVVTGVDGWGLGVVQAIDNAAMEIYVAYRHYEADIKAFDGAGDAVDTNSVPDIDSVMGGARIRF